MSNYKIGDIIKLDNGRKLEIVDVLEKIEGSKHGSCHGCYYSNYECPIIGCIGGNRQDGKDIIFKEIK